MGCNPLHLLYLNRPESCRGYLVQVKQLGRFAATVPDINSL
jgi:hypothetical protein